MAFEIWNYPMAAAQIAVAEGFTSEAAYEVLASMGATVSYQDFARLYGQAQLAADLVGETGQIPLENLPPIELIQHRSTVTSSGYQYQLQVQAVDQGSGEPVQIPYSIRTSQLIPTGEAIDAAIVSQTLRAPDYNLKVLSASLTGVYELHPELEAT